jgi:hypothetical protein
MVTLAEAPHVVVHNAEINAILIIKNVKMVVLKGTVVLDGFFASSILSREEKKDL